MVFYTTTGYSLKAAQGWDTSYQSQHDTVTRQHGHSHTVQHDSSTTNKLTDTLKRCIPCGQFPNLPQYVIRHQVPVTPLNPWKNKNTEQLNQDITILYVRACPSGRGRVRVSASVRACTNGCVEP